MRKEIQDEQLKLVTLHTCAALERLFDVEFDALELLKLYDILYFHGKSFKNILTNVQKKTYSRKV